MPLAEKAFSAVYCDHIYSKNYGFRDDVLSFQNELNILKKYVSSGDILLAYEQVGILHYYLDTIPFLNNPDPIFWSSKQLHSLLGEVVAQKKKLPVAIESMIDLKIFGIQERRNILHSFLKEHGYKKVWSSSYFTIYTPPLSNE